MLRTRHFSAWKEAGLIRRILFGVYEHPDYNEFLGEYVEPSPDMVACFGRKFGWTIVPCGDAICSDFQHKFLPWLYVSDGTYKEYTYGNTTIRFKRTTNKEISKISYKTALVIQALKALGKKHPMRL